MGSAVVGFAGGLTYAAGGWPLLVALAAAGLTGGLLATSGLPFSSPQTAPPTET